MNYEQDLHWASNVSRERKERNAHETLYDTNGLEVGGVRDG